MAALMKSFARAIQSLGKSKLLFRHRRLGVPEKSAGAMKRRRKAARRLLALFVRRDITHSLQLHTGTCKNKVLAGCVKVQLALRAFAPTASAAQSGLEVGFGQTPACENQPNVAAWDAVGVFGRLR